MIKTFSPSFLRQFYFVVFVLMFSLQAKAQYDSLHYIPPVFVSDNIKNNNTHCRDHYLVLSTNETNSFQVTIERGDGSLFSGYTIIDGSQISTGVFNLSRTNPLKLQFNGTGVGVEHIFSNASLNSNLSIGGYKLIGTKRFFANIRHLAGSQGASLTSKGTTALGTTFYTGFQAAGTGTSGVDNQHSNFIAVMATSDNTNVTVDNIKTGVTFLGQPSSGSPATANTITFSLNEGESYILAQIKNNMTTDMNEYNGIRIVSNKDIAVNTGAWTGPSNSGSQRDIGIDQMIPAKYAGIKFGITSGKGDVNGSNPVEKVVVVSTKTGTTTINSGAGGTVTLTGQGDYAILTGNNYWGAASPIYAGTEAHSNMALTSNQPILVFQTLFGNSNRTTSSMNLIPPLADCIGSDSIYIHHPEQFGNSSIISITSPVTSTVKIESQTGATLLTINPSGENFPGTIINDFKTTVYDVPNSVTGIFVTADAKVTVGFLGASSNIGGGGFMSAFSDRKVSYNSELSLFIGNGETKLDLCEENPTNLSVSDNSVYTSYQWYYNEMPLVGETNDTLSVVNPGYYYVVADYCSLPLETPVLTVGEFGSPGGQGFSKISGLYEAETFQGFVNNSAVGTWDDQAKTFNNALAITNGPKIKTDLLGKPGFHPTSHYTASNSEYLKTADTLVNIDGINQYSFFVILRDSNTANGDAVINLGNDVNGPKITKESAGYRFSQSAASAGGLITADVAVATKQFNVISVVSDGATVEMFANGKKGPVTGANTTSNTLDVVGDFIIGGDAEGSSSYFDGTIAEVVIFDTTLSPAERQKVESYYGVKYGITMDATNDETTINDGDYLSNANSIVWDYSANSVYHNQVSGIGYDACGRLNQNQNKNAENNDFVYIGLGSIANTVGSNPNNLTVDDSYFIWGNDLGAFDSYGVTDYGLTLNAEIIQGRVERVWKSQETGVVGSLRVQFNLAGGTNSSIYDLADTRLLVDGNGVFATGATSYSPTSFDNSTGEVNFDHNFAAGTGFYFTLGTVNSVTTPLPITLIDFNAKANSTQEVECTWGTASEQNNEFFTLEKSKYGLNWKEVDKILGAGNSTNVLDYSYTDRNPYNGVSYYRLSQTDFDGKRTDLGVRSVNFTDEADYQLSLYPNPTENSFVLSSTRSLTGEVVIRSSLGQTVKKLNWEDQNQELIDVQTLAKGLYFVECNFGDRREILRVIVK